MIRNLTFTLPSILCLALLVACSNFAPETHHEVPRKSMGAEASVIVKALVRTDGAVGSVILHKSSGVPELDHDALERVKTWKFQPAIKDGKPIECWVLIPIRFDFRKSQE